VTDGGHAPRTVDLLGAVWNAINPLAMIIVCMISQAGAMPNDCLRLLNRLQKTAMASFYWQF